jgi:class 3 adenylate cyclase
MTALQLDERFVPAKRVIVVIDLSGYAKAFQQRDDARVAAFLDDYYAACERILREAGGVIVKFMGDGCLATFEEQEAEAALAALGRLEQSVATARRDHGLDLALGANVHLAPVIDCELGSGSSRRRDIVGRGVNQTFLLGHGSGIRISEPVYRSLPSSARSPWTKHKPPAVYHLER